MKKSHLFALTAAGLLMSGAAMAADQCSTEITGNDAMQYDKASMTVPASCKNFTVTLKHIGKAAKAAMGHDWVLTTAADEQAVVTEAMAAGPSKDYLNPADPKIIAHTKLIGGGETTSVTFPVSKLKAGEQYSYFCTFPGHAGVMKGTLTVK
ncbi:MAG: azurin [Burkholderiaceae bacterium]|jgi:azurin|nr:azurin [Burkholderiaceae bacterium]